MYPATERDTEQELGLGGNPQFPADGVGEHTQRYLGNARETSRRQREEEGLREHAHIGGHPHGVSDLGQEKEGGVRCAEEVEILYGNRASFLVVFPFDSQRLVVGGTLSVAAIAQRARIRCRVE